MNINDVLAQIYCILSLPKGYQVRSEMDLPQYVVQRDFYALAHPHKAAA